MNLYLIRHAIAEDLAITGEDSQRALTDKGARKMRSIARGLRTLGADFDVILSSPYVRAVQTAEILADVFKMKKRLAQSENLVPAADPQQLIAELNETYKVDDLAIVGHEPFLSNLVGLLTAGGTSIEMTFKKGGVCLLTADDLRHSRSASLVWLLTPGVLVEIGER